MAKRFASSSVVASAVISVSGTIPAGVLGSVSLLASASISAVGKIEEFPDTEDFIVYINTAKSVDGNIETSRKFEG